MTENHYLCITIATSRTYHSLHLDISSCQSDRICYVVLPERLKEKELAWLDSMAERHQATFVVISGVSWEEDLTPWKAPCLKGGEFAGKAQYFLEMLKADLFFNMEISLQMKKAEHSIVGVSLSGLFSLGDKEKDGKNKRLASVEEATLEAVDLLKSVGKDVTFEYNEGNHFGPLIERIENGINNLYKNQTKQYIKKEKHIC